jgi:hypothetical protein
MSGKPCHRSQPLQPNFLLQMGFDVLADALGDYRRQPSAAGRERLSDRQVAQGADRRPAVHSRFRPAPRHSGFAKRGRKQRIPRCSVASPHDPGWMSLSPVCRKIERSNSKAADKGTPLPSLSSSRPRMSRAMRRRPASIGARPQPQAMRVRCRRAAQRWSRRGGKCNQAIRSTSPVSWRIWMYCRHCLLLGFLVHKKAFRGNRPCLVAQCLPMGCLAASSDWAWETRFFPPIHVDGLSASRGFDPFRAGREVQKAELTELPHSHSNLRRNFERNHSGTDRKPFMCGHGRRGAKFHEVPPWFHY